METYNSIPGTVLSSISTYKTSNKAIETDLRMGGFRSLGKERFGWYLFSTKTQLIHLALQYIHEEFASGFTVERKLVDDEQYNQISKMSKALSRAARATIETKAIEIFNNAFTTNGFDGVPLISATHKRLDGGAMSNRLAVGDGAGAADGALSDRNLKAALIQTRRQVDDKGVLIQVQPKVLVVPPALEYTARTILESSGLSIMGNGFANTGATLVDAANSKNVIQGKLKVVVMDYLSSNTSWFLLDPSVHELNFFWRKKLEFKQDEDFSTMQAKYRGYMRFSAGYSDYRGVFGSLGTGAA
jgi:hypothetical protein